MQHSLPVAKGTKQALLAPGAPPGPAGYGTFLDEKIKTEFLRRRRRRAASLNTAKWMSKIDDNVLLSGLSLPGTHDSSAYTSGWPFVSTQKMDILQQLNAGIRYFDLRCGLVNNIIEMVHGRALLGLQLDAVLETMYTWLKEHPSEGLVVQVKQDRHEDKSDMPFHKAVYDTIDADTEHWRTAPTTPTMGEVRGKIQLFRRFPGPPYRGVDVSKWEDNPATPFTIHTHHGVQIVIQDHYNPSGPQPLPTMISRKGGDVSDLLTKAALDRDLGRWYVNFASAYELNIIFQFTPRQVALGGWWDFQWVAGINPMLSVYIKEHTYGRKRRRYGVVMMDFPEQPAPDLISDIIRSNFGEQKSGSIHPIAWVVVLLLAVYLAGLVLLFIHGRVERPWCPPWLHSCAPRNTP